jgi:hypothetical protein
MAIEDDLRSFVLADTTVQTFIPGGTGRMYYNHVPDRPADEQNTDLLLIYQFGGDNDLCFDDPVGADPFRNLFTIECLSRDIDRAKNLYRAVWRRLNNYRGSLGSGLVSVQGIYCDNPDDDFVARGMDDQGWELCALQAEVIP